MPRQKGRVKGTRGKVSWRMLRKRGQGGFKVVFPKGGFQRVAVRVSLKRGQALCGELQKKGCSNKEHFPKVMFQKGVFPNGFTRCRFSVRGPAEPFWGWLVLSAGVMSVIWRVSSPYSVFETIFCDFFLLIPLWGALRPHCYS